MTVRDESSKLILGLFREIFKLASEVMHNNDDLKE